MSPETLEDERIGIPRVTRPVPPKPQPERGVEEPLLRAGETELGRPIQAPESVSPLTDSDRKNLREAEEAQALRDLSEAEELLASDPALPALGWLRHPVAAAFLLGSAGALGLFVYSQCLQILGALAAQPPVFQYLGYAGLILCCVAVLYAFGRFALLFLKLRRNRQLQVKGLDELNRRTRLRWLAHAKAGEAKQRLEQYLREFPMATNGDKKKLVFIGFTAERIEVMERVRTELLDPAKFTGSAEWFERFRIGFQGSLDLAANERIGAWARRCGLTAAAAPNGLVDSVAMFYHGFAMLADLCQVYNLRTGKTGTAVLLGRVFFNSYLSGQLSEWEKLTEEQLNQMMAPHGPLYELTAARVLSKVGAKATTGLLSYFMLARLGKYACRLLRPVG